MHKWYGSSTSWLTYYPVAQFGRPGFRLFPHEHSSLFPLDQLHPWTKKWDNLLGFFYSLGDKVQHFNTRKKPREPCHTRMKTIGRQHPQGKHASRGDVIGPKQTHK